MSVLQQTTQQARDAVTDAILSLNNIEVMYDHVILVLKGVSLDVPRGQIVALLGANGAGKRSPVTRPAASSRCAPSAAP